MLKEVSLTVDEVVLFFEDGIKLLTKVSQVEVSEFNWVAGLPEFWLPMNSTPRRE